MDYQPNKQQNKTIELTDNLLAALKASKDFVQLKTAVLAYIEMLDEETYVLGDLDICQLAGDALDRRGKPRHWAGAFASFCEFIDSDELPELLEQDGWNPDEGAAGYN